MAAFQGPDPVKRVVAALWSDAPALQAAKAEMQARWGEIDFEGADRPFDVTSYYEEEMGKDLRRRLIAFSRLMPPEELPAAKLDAAGIEEKLRRPPGRRVNLDAGYLDDHKLVLASFKRAGQKVYLERGVYADLVCRFAGGRFKNFEWTFPDFRDGRYEKDLLQIRALYMEQLRKTRASGCSGR